MFFTTAVMRDSTSSYIVFVFDSRRDSKGKRQAGSWLCDEQSVYQWRDSNATGHVITLRRMSHAHQVICSPLHWFFDTSGRWTSGRWMLLHCLWMCAWLILPW